MLKHSTLIPRSVRKSFRKLLEIFEFFGRRRRGGVGVVERETRETKDMETASEYFPSREFCMLDSLDLHKI